MAKEYRADIFTADREHKRAFFETEAEAIAFISGAKESGASAGFLLKYAHTTCSGIDLYDVDREIFHTSDVL